MDIEFHYYITYLIAARAGFKPAEAEIIAYASQHIDDNDLIYEINQDTAEYYSNYVSQTINILKTKRVLLRIYPIFHFIPGDPFIDSVRRWDGKLHYLNTTPDSENAQAVLHTALESNNLYRIGLACHSFSDSWAHKNFTGYFDQFNSMKTPFKKLGHVAALGKPDRVALKWHDSRLVSSLQSIDNRQKFLQAATRLFEEFQKHLFTDKALKDIQTEADLMAEDLNWAIGDEDARNKNTRVRLARYKELAKKNEYGGCELADYDLFTWMDEAIKENIRGFRIRSKRVVTRFIKGYLSKAIPRLQDRYTWKDPLKYKQSHWYQFQEAVKAQQKSTSQILEKATLWKLELDPKSW